MTDINEEIDWNYSGLLTTRASNAVMHYNTVFPNSPIKTIKDLAAVDKIEFLKLVNCGRKTVRELENLLEERGLRFGMTEDDSNKAGLSKIKVVSQNVEITLGADIFEGVKQAFKYAYDNNIDVIVERANGFKITIEKIT